MLFGRHSIESTLLALVSANIPALRLVGCLACAGFHFDRRALARLTGGGASLGATKRLIRSRINLCQELWKELETQHQSWGYLRWPDGTIGDGSFLASPMDEEGEVLAHAEKVFWHEEHQGRKVAALRLWRIERAFVEAVKKGDRTLFDAAVAN